ncbi:MAG: hypothetical protein WAX38_00450 [Minisyncoccia bacterium]
MTRGESGAHAHEHVVKRLYPYYKTTAEAESADAIKRVTLGREHDPARAKKSPTLMDFQGIPEDTTDAQIISYVSFATGIPEIILNGGGKSPSEDMQREVDRVYTLLRESFTDGRKYLRSVLHYSESELKVAHNPEEIKNAHDLVQFLRETRLAKDQKGIGRSVVYCRLAKMGLVAYHALRTEGKALVREAEYIQRKLLPSKREVLPDVLYPLSEVHLVDGRRIFTTNFRPAVTGSLFIRGKDFFSQMTKYVTRPDSSVETAQKDGVGMMFEVDEESARDFLPVLCNWLHDDMGVTSVEIENYGFYTSRNDMQLLGESMKSFRLTGLVQLKNDSQANSTSSGDYRALKIEGYIAIPLNGDEKERTVRRRFEIQIVPKINNHKKIKVHHDVYDVIKKVTARTRLDGACPYTVFEEFCREAGRKSGFDFENVLKELLGDLRLTYAKRKNRIFANDVYDRWLAIGWIDEALYTDLIRTRK